MNFSEKTTILTRSITSETPKHVSANTRLKENYSKHTEKTVDEIKSALERDNFMTAETAKSFGLIDEVVEKRT